MYEGFLQFGRHSLAFKDSRLLTVDFMNKALSQPVEEIEELASLPRTCNDWS
jgi:hypothetical protein